MPRAIYHVLVQLSASGMGRQQPRTHAYELMAGVGNHGAALYKSAFRAQRSSHGPIDFCVE
jgi:hypothetical protein